MSELGLVEIAGIVVVIGLIAWQVLFFQVVRPRIMARIGRRLNADVQESIGPWDAGVYDTARGTPVRKTAAVAAADFAVTLVGVVGVIAAVTIPLFLLAESGLPSRWEGQLTGTAVRIGEVTAPPMTGSSTTAHVTVRNEARGAMRACQVSVPGYRARDGYLTGSSTYFDLAPAATTSVDLPLRVTTRVPGTHRFRISVECSQRIRDRVVAVLDVRE